MADTQTVHYRMVMPDVGHAATTWGDSLNGDLVTIDAQMFANQQAGLPVGSIAMFAAGSTGPAINWLICNGLSLSTTTYAALFAVIGYTYGGAGGSFLLPNLQQKFPIGAGTGYALASTGGEATHVLTTAELPSHTHPITDKQHSHAVNNVVATSGGGHSATGGAGQNVVDITTQPAFTGITATNTAGSGTAHNNIPPYVVINFIIRAS
jgi:microcystin-dependent protein